LSTSASLLAASTPDFGRPVVLHDQLELSPEHPAGPVDFIGR
jgi:hypothetical protein